MKFVHESGPVTDIACDWLIVGMWENDSLEGPLGELNAKLGGLLTRLQEKGDVTGKAKELTPLLDTQGLAGSLEAGRVMIVGLGRQDQVNLLRLFQSAAAAAKSITEKPVTRMAMTLPADTGPIAPRQTAQTLLAGLSHGCEGAGIRKKKPDRYSPAEIVLLTGEAWSEEVVRRAEAEARAVSLARELVNMPPCELYPETFADRARDIAQRTGLECQVLGVNELEDERMNVLLAVGKGSDKPARVVVLRHRKGGSGRTLGLVGKGVTFDSGGLSLKPTDGMVDMKCDMAGAAAVLGAMQAIALEDLPVNVIGVMALVENMPGGRSMKLGDVFQARNGKTVEVLNTDAEGRLILADALAYAVDQGVHQLVDLATLTGACMVALGTEVAGLMSNNPEWSEKVRSAADAVGELVWPLPMFPFYGDMIKSDIADIKNTGGARWAGAISAAKFLEEFVASVPWVHLDIAGPAWTDKDSAWRSPGGTGWFVRTLVELARNYA